MYLIAPPLPVFLLIPLAVGFPFALARKRLGGWLIASVLTVSVSTVICIAIGIWQVGYSPTGASIGTAFTVVQYVPLSLASVALWAWCEKKVRGSAGP